ncbi:mitochondrial import receptor subunit TOM40 homolog 1-like isoform X2 [Mytilus californianus]|uniref:mitochondrial import receptor subunit TOM40 homolog 1-like isoform X2 n=1 Tax=Mytilus californianus TaxID=6549 RepID=UPI002246276F|nr:mitochondrial import receptor subunit TOM40 homolog 1-like isoform X2 [Mytilus californianus]
MGNKISAAGQNETAGCLASPQSIITPSDSSSSSTEPPKPIEQIASGHNPGTFEELHRKCEDIFPQCFQGGKIIVSKELSSHFQVSHTINFSTVERASSGYKFGATYVGTRKLDSQEMCPPGLVDTVDSETKDPTEKLVTRITPAGLVDIDINPASIANSTATYEANRKANNEANREANNEANRETKRRKANRKEVYVLKATKRYASADIRPKLVTQMYPVVSGDIDGNGNLNATLIYGLTQKLRSKLITQIKGNKFVAFQGSMEYRGINETLSVTVGNPDIVNKSGILVGQYLHQVTPHLALGCEGLYRQYPEIPHGENITVSTVNADSSCLRSYPEVLQAKYTAAFSLAAKFTGDEWTLSGNFSPLVGDAHLCYHHKITEELDVGAVIETRFAHGESVCKLGYQLNFPEASMKFRGSVDTNWGLEATLEEELSPLFPFTFALSGMASFANFQRPLYRFGIGLIIG